MLPTSLLLAAFHGAIQPLKARLAAGDDPNQTDTCDGSTALLFAAQQGHRKAVKTLLAASANINQSNAKGTVPLKIAAQQGHLEVINELLAADPAPALDACSNDGMSALIMAAKKGHVNIVSRLIGAKASVQLSTDGGMTALDFCVQHNHAPSVRALLQAGAIVDDAGCTGDEMTALCMAARDAGPVVVRELLAAKASANHRTSRDDGQTPLHYAVVECNTRAVRPLLEGKADPCLTDSSGRSALHRLAALHPHNEATSAELQKTYAALLAAAADQSSLDLDAADANGVSALHQAIVADNPRVVQLLLDAGATVGKCGSGALQDVVGRGDLVMLERMLACGADPNRPHAWPLHQAIHLDGIAASGLVQALLHAHADPNRRMPLGANAAEEEGQTPLHAAASKGDVVLARLLIQAHADVDTADSLGQRALLLAIGISQMYEMVELLVAANAALEISTDAAGDGPITPLDLAASYDRHDIVALLQATRLARQRLPYASSRRLHLETPDMRAMKCSLTMSEGQRMQVRLFLLEAATVYQPCADDPHGRASEVQFQGARVAQLHSTVSGTDHAHGSFPLMLALCGEVVLSPGCLHKLRLDMHGGKGAAAEWPDERAVLQCPACARQATPGANAMLAVHTLIAKSSQGDVAMAFRAQPRLFCTDCARALWQSSENASEVPSYDTAFPALNLFPAASKKRQAARGVTVADAIEHLLQNGTLAAVCSEAGRSFSAIVDDQLGSGTMESRGAESAGILTKGQLTCDMKHAMERSTTEFVRPDGKRVVNTGIDGGNDELRGMMRLSTAKDRAALAAMDASGWEGQGVQMRAALLLVAEFASGACATPSLGEHSLAAEGLPTDVMRAADFVQTRLQVLFKLEKEAQNKRTPGAPPSAPKDLLRHMMLRKLAEDNTMHALVTACVSCGDALAQVVPPAAPVPPRGLCAGHGAENTPHSSKKRSKKKTPVTRATLEPSDTSAVPMQVAGLQASVEQLVFILNHLSDVPDLAKALAHLPQAADLLLCVRRNILWQDARLQCSNGQRHYFHAEALCTITTALQKHLEWSTIMHLVREGLAATVVAECITRDRPNSECPGAPVALAIRVLVSLAARAVHEVGAGRASHEEAEEILGTIGALRPFEAAMAALARGDLWRSILPCHAFDFVNYCYMTSLLVLPGDSWGRLHSLPSVRRPIEATLRSLAQRQWPYALNMHGNEIGPQIVGEAMDAIELLTQIAHGFPRPDPYEMLLLSDDALRQNRRHIKPALEAKRCSACLKSETDLGADTKLMACARCGVPLYCSKDCQKIDWKKGHKERCLPCVS